MFVVEKNNLIIESNAFIEQIKNKIKMQGMMMKKNTQYTEASEYSTTMSRVTQRTKIFDSQNRKSRFNSFGNIVKKNENDMESTKIQLKVKRRNINKKLIEQENKTERPRVNPNNFKLDIKTIVPIDQPFQKLKFGISTCKGFKNSTNTHQVGVYLGLYKYIFLAEGYDGNEAAKMVKDIFPSQFNRLAEKQIHQEPQKYLTEIYSQTQKKILRQQQICDNNSGVSLLSVFCLKEIIAVANCGASKAICCTQRGQILNLADTHSTKNKEEVERVLSSGGKIYQTILEVPEEKYLMIGGPLRLSKSGLFYTRTLGKSKHFQNPENNLNGLIFKPETTFINKREVKWIAVLSENIIQYCNSKMIKECIDFELMSLSECYGYNQIAKECSRKLTQKMLELGISDSITIIILFPNILPDINTAYAENISDRESSVQNKNASFYSQTVHIPIKKYSTLVNSQRSFIFKK